MIAILRHLLASRTASRRTPSRRARPGVESLEGRQLLSVSTPERVNTKVEFSQDNSATASNGAGIKVVVWADVYSSSDIDIRAQRYDAQGNRLGPEIKVDYTSYVDYEPSVGISDRGDFVVAWTRTVSPGVTAVVAKRFEATGAAIGGVFEVNSRKAYDANAQYNSASAPDVAMDANGNFAVAYQYAYGSSDNDIWVRHYDAYGSQLLRVDTSGLDDTMPSVAMTPGGDFVVAWSKKVTPSQGDVYAMRFGADRTYRTGALAIATGPTWEFSPDVAVNYYGEAVTAYVVQAADGNLDVAARRLGANNAVSLPISIASGPRAEYNPSVAMYRWGGDFLVAFDNQNEAYGNTYGTSLVAVSSQNARMWSWSTYVFDTLSAVPSVSMDADGNFLMSFTARFAGQAGSNDRDIQRVVGRIWN